MKLRGLSHRRVIIVGSGHAGLSVAAELSRSGLQPQRDFAVIDSNPDGQRSWAFRWSSMELLTEAGRSTVAGQHLTGDPYRRPSPREIEQHLLDVESSLGVTTMWGIRATGVERLGDGSTLLLSTNEGPVQTRNVVCATGAAARPRTLGWAVGAAVPGIMVHSADYHGPGQIPRGDVLVVGAGHSGQQIARELSSTHRVTLSSRPTYASAGRPIRRLVGRRRTDARGAAALSLDPEWAQLGIDVVSAAVAADGAHIVFDDGRRIAPQSIIFATGYRPADGWLPRRVLDATSGRGKRGTTGVPGLFVVGMPTYGSRDADTFAGARRDAISIARHIMKRP
ncbi:hypothetical protein GCM10009569_20220 [Arthrobacter russicus]